MNSGYIVVTKAKKIKSDVWVILKDKILLN